MVRTLRQLVSLFFFALVILSAHYASAAPRGAVQLDASKLFQSGNFYCGFINERWISGKLIRGGFFYSRSAERSNVLKKARNASGDRKDALKRKAAQLKQKIRTEGPTCATGPVATATPTPTVTPTFSLNKISDSLYNTEHALFIIPAAGQVTWTGDASWDSVYSTSNISSYVATLREQFPGDYFMAVITASDLLPNRVPNVLTYRDIADGIGQSTTDSAGTNICRYHSEGAVSNTIFAVLDHEVGHNWGVFIGTEVAEGHWHSNSTATGLMANIYSDDGFTTFKQIAGDPSGGFTWTTVDNNASNETDTFSDRDLYLMGLNHQFPTLHVLTSPVYNANGTVSYTSVASYDQAWVEGRHGLRNPNYQNSEKEFKFGFVYVARDLAEIESAYQPLERSIRHFIYAEDFDTVSYRFQVPFLVATKKRASINARLANLDGNSPPSITLTSGSYFTASGGSAAVPFSVSDTSGTPAVSCVPTASNCSVSGSQVLVTGLTSGSYFFTFKAEDSSGKKDFAHFVVDAP